MTGLQLGKGDGDCIRGVRRIEHDDAALERAAKDSAFSGSPPAEDSSVVRSVDFCRCHSRERGRFSYHENLKMKHFHLVWTDFSFAQRSSV